jgi:hypothetical protein
MLTPLWLSMARRLLPSSSGSTPSAQDRAPPLPPARNHTRHHPSLPVLPLSGRPLPACNSQKGGPQLSRWVCGRGKSVCLLRPPRHSPAQPPLSPRFAPCPDRSQRSLYSYRLSCVELPLAAATHDDGARGGVAPKRMGAVGIDPTTTALHKVPHPPFSVPELPQGTEEVDSYAKTASDALPTELCTLSH